MLRHVLQGADLKVPLLIARKGTGKERELRLRLVVIALRQLTRQPRALARQLTSGQPPGVQPRQHVKDASEIAMPTINAHGVAFRPRPGPPGPWRFTLRTVLSQQHEVTQGVDAEEELLIREDVGMPKPPSASSSSVLRRTCSFTSGVPAAASNAWTSSPAALTQAPTRSGSVKQR